LDDAVPTVLLATLKQSGDCGGGVLSCPAGAARTFSDSGISGSTIERPQLSKALDRLETGDELTVRKLDRPGNNAPHVLGVIRYRPRIR
jgi:hypothetical protein